MYLMVTPPLSRLGTSTRQITKDNEELDMMDCGASKTTAEKGVEWNE